MEMRVVNHDEEGSQRVERMVIPETRRPDTVHHFVKKLADKGVLRMDRHSADGVHIAKPPPKSGHGGKFTWEGPGPEAESELDPVPPAIDEGDPNYVDEEKEAASAVETGAVVGVVEVAKLAEAKAGVSRIDLIPPLLQPYQIINLSPPNPRT